MNYADIKRYDVANGPGVRVSVFVSGCTHRCPGCFNEEAWDFNFGKPFTQETIDYIIDLLKPDFYKGITFLGGEPLEHVNQQGLLPLARKIREVYPEKSIWCFTGYDFEKDVLGRMINEWPETKELLSYIDVLVDGEFIEAQKDLSLVFKGSANQRHILVQESMKSGSLVLWEKPEYITNF
ncbi:MULTISPECIES: anaerobic ribonucleoside-triphosphate reductase activating protein [Eubacterium]|jgi:anaerobic ribonucleoside-triphosphate reductase activating protein|uniref:Anaerobic ribonucleoside-triphosphate reductase-activating protein n=1 Tax=Eubacterium album TaxID=2978477 RepID=A0ABT2LZ51_9FIRM|nr:MULTISPECIES: anaerobic ribonucleoside-triphosphate reductase activating protein [unclassified Eubacterium (in: firmicutes)]MEE0295257.1 anaerobic ribonucleoside-triphosphate reductase activating protein [Eubacterium sp.]CDA29725.1 anaerobic ribonucleoside-triphosphate reductase-activating protein [Eubacterium sp. CAG:156]MCT7398578.1 anaerobic ribonucleoside-triphosphate reductase activating protein [Eubacterium sp. LFL-14]RGG65624.1 anaerobic ribonucleoside-triphosphate reductase activatin